MSNNRQPLLSRFSRPERLLPLACIAAAAALFASELMTTFQFTPPGGEPLCAQQAGDRHHFALGVLAILAVAAVIVAVLAASKPAAWSVAIAGGLALLLFLIIDLPDANNLGTLGGCSPTTAGSFFDAKAVPQAGFWLEMVGALGLALSGAALATLSPDQLATLRPRRLSGSKRSRETDRPASIDRRAELEASAPANPRDDAGQDRPARARGARRN